MDNNQVMQTILNALAKSAQQQGVSFEVVGAVQGLSVNEVELDLDGQRFLIQSMAVKSVRDDYHEG